MRRHHVLSFLTASLVASAAGCGTSPSSRPAEKSSKLAPEPRPAPVRRARPARPAAPKVRARPRKTPHVLRAERETEHRRVGIDHDPATSDSVVSKLALALRPDGSAELTDEGKAKSSVLTRVSGYSGDRTTWKNTWRGTWKSQSVLGSGQVLLVELHLLKQTCERIQSRRRAGATSATETKQKCPKKRKRMTVRCERGTVRVRPHMRQSGSTATLQPVRKCRIVGKGPTITGTPMPWVFGVKDCLRRAGGRRRRVYELCSSKP